MTDINNNKYYIHNLTSPWSPMNRLKHDLITLMNISVTLHILRSHVYIYIAFNRF